MLNIITKTNDLNIKSFVESFFYVSNKSETNEIIDLLIDKNGHYFNELNKLNVDNTIDKTKNINNFIGLINISSIKDELKENNINIEIDEIFILPKNTNKDDFIANVIKDKDGLLNFLLLFTRVMYKYHNSNKIHFSNGENSKDYLFLRNTLIKKIKKMYFQDFINKENINIKNNNEYNEKTFQKALNTGQFIITNNNEIIFNVFDIKTKFFQNEHIDKNELYELTGALIYTYYIDVLNDDKEIKHQKDKLKKNYDKLKLEKDNIQSNFKILEDKFKKIQTKYSKTIELELLNLVKKFLFPKNNINDIQGILDFQNLWEELCGQYYIKDKAEDILFIDVESYENNIDKLKPYFENTNMKICNNNNIVIIKTINRKYYENDIEINAFYTIEDKTIRPDLIYKNIKDNNIIYIKDFKNWNINNINDVVFNHKPDIIKQEQYIDLFKSNIIENNQLNERSIFIIPYYESIKSNTKLNYKDIDIKKYSLDKLDNLLNKIKVVNNNIIIYDIVDNNSIVTSNKNNTKGKLFKELKDNELDFALKFQEDKENANIEKLRRTNENNKISKLSLEKDIETIKKYKEYLETNILYQNDYHIKLEYLNWYDLMVNLISK